MENAKKPWQSKTFWFAFVSALITFVGGFIPALDTFFKANPEVPVYVLTAIFVLLRVFTKDKVVIG